MKVKDTTLIELRSCQGWYDCKNYPPPGGGGDCCAYWCGVDPL